MNKLNRNISLLFAGAVALGAATGCVNNNDLVKTNKTATCWQYPGGESASGELAPLGQRLLSTLSENTDLTVKAGDALGATVGRYTRVVDENGKACWILTSSISK
ncbi:MAG: hypothetical protein WAV41_01405 [Microgenomates group bacterium]